MRNYFLSITATLCIFLFELPTYAADTALTKTSPSQAPSSCMSSTQPISSLELASPNIATVLGWVSDPVNKKTNICGGHYVEPDQILANPNPLPIKESPTKIIAKKPAFVSQYGTSVLQGNVVITQPGRELSADKITLSRDKKTGKINSSTLIGNVHLREYGKILVAEKGYIDFQNDTRKLNNATYRLITASPTGYVNAWGKACSIFRNALGILKLRKASYSTCAPPDNDWQIWSDYLTLNNTTGRGHAINTLFYLKNTPIFYMPYFSFPIDKQRKSGFLYPNYKYSARSGVDIGFPYYFNLAPNYDFTFTPEPIFKRGLLVKNDFRYLTEKSNGTLDINLIPHDNAFAKFRNAAPSQYTSSQTKHSLSQLENSKNSRGYFGWQNYTNFNPHWNSSINLNYVTDDYFMQDFTSTQGDTNTDQLLNQADINYISEHWHFLGKILAFQTLHPINQFQIPSADQYRRLPQLDLIGDIPNPNDTLGLQYQFSGEFVNFEHRDNFYDGTPVINGERLHIQPTIELPLSIAGGFIKTKLQLQATNYSLYNRSLADIHADHIITRIIPVLSLDSGLFFSRALQLFSTTYTQTLEPRLFYLYVPEKNQNNIPIFDTTLPGFDFSQLFRTNRFSGLDRIGDANQITLAVTSRFLNDFGQEKLSAGLGQMFLLHKHKVCLESSCISDPLTKDNLSPVVGMLQYNLNDYWNASANSAWDPNYNQFDTAILNLQYNNDTRHIINFWYNFILHGDTLPIMGKSDSLNRFGFSLTWSLGQHWNILGNWNYNISHSVPQNYLYGVEYESCCWAIRLVHSNTFINIDANGHNHFDSAVYLQFLLKGLGNFGTNDAGGLLTNRISGFQDKFATGYKL